jgi:AcrR family transcriptional regulator
VSKKKRPGAVGGKRQENRLQKTQTLTAAALSLFLEHGIEGVAIDDIIARAGMAKGNFYRYFADKRALVEALITPVRAAVLGVLTRCEQALAAARDDGELVAAYQAAALEIAGVVLAELDVVRLYVQESRAANVGARAPICALAGELADWSYALTLAAESHGLLRHVNARVTAVAVLGAVERLIFEALRGAPADTPAAVGEALIAMVLDGLRSPLKPIAKPASRGGAPPKANADRD